MNKGHLTLVLATAVASSAALAGNDAGKAVAWYKALDYTCCVKGAPPVPYSPWNDGPVQSHPNPDPDWIPGYSQLQIKDDAVEALVQAAINRTWTEQCHQEFARYRAGWKTIEAQVRPELDKLKQGNFYDRRKGLIGLLVAERKAAADAKLVLPAGNPGRYAGLDDEVVRAVFDLYHDSKRDFALPAQVARLGDVKALVQQGRPWLEDADEQDAYCSNAEIAGGLALPPRPRITDRPPSLAAIRPAIAKDRADAVRVKAKQLQVGEQASFVVPDRRDANIVKGELATDRAEPKLYFVYLPKDHEPTELDYDVALAIQSVKQTGGATTIVLEGKRHTGDVPYGCHPAPHALPGDDPICKHGTRDVTEHVTVTFSDLPASLQLEKGDVLSLWADLDSQQTKHVVDTAAKGIARQEIKMTGRQLLEVHRGDQVIVP